MKFVTIKESHAESYLLVLKSKLESEGISCFLKNEFTTQIMNHMARFIVELKVPDSEVKRAKKILEEFK